MKDHLHDVKALLATLGIDHEFDSSDVASDSNVMFLMNMALQCLGSIRILVELQQKRSADNARVHAKPNDISNLAIRKVFSSAANRFLNGIVSGKELNDLNPSRHLLESFPNSVSFASSSWLTLQWAVFGSSLEQVQSFPTPSQSISLAVEDGESESTNEAAIFVKAIATSFPDTILEVDREGRTFLHYAARLNSPLIMKTALQVRCPRICMHVKVLMCC